MKSVRTKNNINNTYVYEWLQSGSGFHISHANTTQLEETWMFLGPSHRPGIFGGYMLLKAPNGLACPHRGFEAFRFYHQGLRAIREEQPGAVEIICLDQGESK